MKKFILKFTIFITLFVVTFRLFIGATEEKLLRVYGPNTQMQIEQSFKYALKEEYNLIILGNSRMYRGINPDMFNVNTYNFAHDNDTYNQMYYKLLYLEKNNNLPNSVLIGTDYFQFSFIADTRNYIYKSLLDPEYMKDYSFHFNEDMNRRMTELQNNLLLRWNSIFEEEDENRRYLKGNGQFIIPGIPSETDTVTRESKMLPIQKEYFEKIIEYCKDKNIKVIVVMPPLRKNELINYTDEYLKEFNQYINDSLGEDGVYLNFTYDARFNINDFTDITHLDKEGADKFSKILWDRFKINFP
ncbi:DUF1574 domain-containing protein [Oceanirhabdus seepicola]|uniref:DUF1574 domain-containing protein n=1 Tax=Oceanirhabdus seepicola TaxID=2828781 RepID=A0A9J6P235_9CLOT|nr:DUF1574 domain-containing protein [Oceanirhabdus seepicola]MCM1990254.1 hypothetical protein [Oceanirhabdus seepicola]